MSDAETRLKALWAATEAPARDLAFELAVEERIARRRLALDLAPFAAAAVAIAAALFAAGPDVLAGARSLVASFDAAGPVLAAVAAIGAVMVWLTRVPDEAV